MQAVRRLSIAILWLFTLVITYTEFPALEETVDAYCAMKGCSVGNGYVKLIWLVIGSIFVVTLLIHFILMRLFADPKKLVYQGTTKIP